MSLYPQPIEDLIEQLQRLPTIGRKSAQRLALRIVNMDPKQVEGLRKALLDVTTKIRRCSHCGNLSEKELCSICADEERDRSTICVVEDTTNLIAIEKGGTYRGLYHVLHGLVSPLSDMGPEDINLESLIARVDAGGVREVILAISPTVDGEMTTLFLANLLKDRDLSVTRIASGIPVGGSLEYYDELTLSRALDERRSF